MADGEVRGHLPVAVRGGARAAARPGAVLPVLQRGAFASNLRVPHAGDSLPGALGAYQGGSGWAGRSLRGEGLGRWSAASCLAAFAPLRPARPQAETWESGVLQNCS